MAELQPLVPPREEWDQCDIVDAIYFPHVDEERPALLVTPACDIVHGARKTSYWTFAVLERDTAVLGALMAQQLDFWPPKANLSKKQQKAAAQFVTQMMEQRFPRFHWLPARIGDHTGYIVDFACVVSVQLDEAKRARRLFSLQSSWREQIPARYVAYMGRVGTEDYTPEFLDEAVNRVLEACASETETTG